MKFSGLMIAAVVTGCVGGYAIAARDFPEYEEAISVFMELISGCAPEVTVISAQLVAELENPGDVYQIRPKVLPSDLDVIAHLKLCDFEDKYGFFLRKSEDSYEIIGYSAFSQPE